MQLYSKTIFITLINLMLFNLVGCSTASNSDGAPSFYVDANQIPNAVPRQLKKSRYGNPHSYQVNGKRYYVLNSARNYNKTGIASWYGTKFHGKLTSSREPYNMLAMTAASPVLPIPCYVRVTNLENGKHVIVKVNDRGPFAPNRIIDLSYVAAKKLGYMKKGTALVRVTTVENNSPVLINQDPRLFLQIGAFTDYNNAARLKARTSLLTNDRIEIRSVNQDGQRLFRVQVGPLRGVGESDNLLSKLTQAGYSNMFSIVE